MPDVTETLNGALASDQSIMRSQKRQDVDVDVSDAEPKRGLLGRLNELARDLKSEIKDQHWLHVAAYSVTILATVVSILVAVAGGLTYLAEIPDRAELRRLDRLQAVNLAWETLRNTHGAPTERGQSFALQTLNDLGISLSQLDISGTAFSDVLLKNRTIHGLNGNDAVLTHIDFSQSDMTDSNFDKAIFYGVTMDRLRYGLPTNFRFARLVDTSCHDDLLTLAAVRIGQINGEVAGLEERMGDQDELIDAQKKALDVQELKIESLTSRIDDLEQKVR